MRAAPGRPSLRPRPPRRPPQGRGERLRSLMKMSPSVRRTKPLPVRQCQAFLSTQRSIRQARWSRISPVEHRRSTTAAAGSPDARGVPCRPTGWVRVVAPQRAPPGEAAWRTSGRSARGHRVAARRVVGWVDAWLHAGPQGDGLISPVLRRLGLVWVAVSLPFTTGVRPRPVAGPYVFVLIFMAFGAYTTPAWSPGAGRAAGPAGRPRQLPPALRRPRALPDRPGHARRPGDRLALGQPAGPAVVVLGPLHMIGLAMLVRSPFGPPGPAGRRHRGRSPPSSRCRRRSWCCGARRSSRPRTPGSRSPPPSAADPHHGAPTGPWRCRAARARPQRRSRLRRRAGAGGDRSTSCLQTPRACPASRCRRRR